MDVLVPELAWFASVVVMVFITVALLVLHVGAAIKHQLERNQAAGPMPPFNTSGEEPVPTP